MMERDPERLLKGAENGAARELLLAARAEEAPRAVRDRVLSTLAAAFARARANAASVPASKLSGIFERLEESSSKPPLVPRPLLERRTLEQLVVSPLDAAPIELRRLSRRTGRAPVVKRIPIAVQLGAAVLVGVLGATGVHFVSGVASRARSTDADGAVSTDADRAVSSSADRAVSSRAEGAASPRDDLLAGAEDGVRRRTAPSNADRAASSLRATVSTEAEVSPPAHVSPRAVSPRAEALPGAGAVPPRTPVGVAPVRAISALESPVDVLSANEVPGIEVRHVPLRGSDAPLGASAGVRSARSCAAGCSRPDAPAAARTTARAAFDELASEHALSEDWLGEQLALVSRAERSLAQGNTADALRSLDEYQVRFPKGLLDLEIAALRDKAERNSSIADVSETPRSVVDGASIER